MLRRLFARADSKNAMEIDVTRFLADRSERNIQIVDVRERNEWNRGHIAEAVHIPLGELATRYTELDPSRPLVAVCQSGRRSLDAVRTLQPVGFTDVASLAGGMQAWRRANQPIQQ